MRTYNTSSNFAAAKNSPVWIAMCMSMLLLIQCTFAQDAPRKSTGTLTNQMTGKLQWLGKAVIDQAGAATQAQSGDMFEYMSMNTQTAFWPAMQKEPLSMVLTQVDQLPQSNAASVWNKWLAKSGLTVADATLQNVAIKYSIAYLIDANGQLMEASIKGDGSLQQDAVLQQFIQQKQWTAAQLQGQAVAYRGYINLVFLQ